MNFHMMLFSTPENFMQGNCKVTCTKEVTEMAVEYF